MSQNYLPTRILIGRVIAYYEKVNNPEVKRKRNVLEHDMTPQALHCLVKIHLFLLV